MSSTVAQRTTGTPKRWGAAKQATTCREDQESLRSFQQSVQPLGHFMYGSKGKLAKLNYMDIKLLLNRCIVKNKRAVRQKGKFRCWLRTGMAAIWKEILD